MTLTRQTSFSILIRRGRRRSIFSVRTAAALVVLLAQQNSNINAQTEEHWISVRQTTQTSIPAEPARLPSDGTAGDGLLNGSSQLSAHAFSEARPKAGIGRAESKVRKRGSAGHAILPAVHEVTAGRIESEVPVVSDQRTGILKTAAVESAVASDADSASTPFLDLTAPVAQQAEHPANMISSGAPVDLIRMIAWGLILICGCCLTVLAARRWQRNRGLLPTTNSRSRVLETLSLGPGRTLSLVEINGLRALVGSDAGGIRSIVLAPQSFEEEITEYSGESDYRHGDASRAAQ